MTVLGAFVEHEAPLGKIVVQRVELADQRSGFIRLDHADPRQTFDVDFARFDIVREEFAIEHDVIRGEETHDACVDRDAFLLPEEIAHRASTPSFASAASGATSNRSAVARRLSSTVPLARPRGPTTSCHGKPIRSIVENLTPARSVVSSYNTSTPAACRFA